MEKVPHFLIVGGQRCGTTFLYNVLKQHPQLCASSTKESNFLTLQDIRCTDRYANYWINRCPNQLCFEASAGYLLSPVSPFVAHGVNEGMKVIVSLRDPVERTYSAWRFTLVQRPNIRSKYTMIEWCGGTGRKDPYNSILKYGTYIVGVRNWTEIFGRLNVHIVDFRDLVSRPRETIIQILQFLGVSTDHQFDLGVERQFVPRIASVDIPPMTDNERAWLSKFFRLPNAMLYDYLGRDFGWQ